VGKCDCGSAGIRSIVDCSRVIVIYGEGSPVMPFLCYREYAEKRGLRRVTKACTSIVTHENIKTLSLSILARMPNK